MKLKIKLFIIFLMLQNIFLDRLKPIFFKEQIDIVNISFPIYEKIMNNKSSLLDILSENTKKQRIHKLRITKPYLMKIIYYLKTLAKVWEVSSLIIPF